MNEDERWGGRDGFWPTPIQELLLRAALLPDQRAIDAWRTLRPQLDVARLDAAAQRVIPALHRNLSALGVADESLGLLKGVRRFTWARNQMLLRDMLPAVSELQRAAIPTMLLKGAALIADQRMDAGMRAMNDIDVLVPTDRVRAAIDVVVRAGMRPVDELPTWCVTDYVPRFSPSYGFAGDTDGQLDLHWHAFHACCQPDADDDLWSASVSVKLLGMPLRALCPADELLLVILHGLRWDQGSSYGWVVDAALLAGGSFGSVDYDRLVEQARRRRVVAPARAGLAYLRRLVDSPVPDRIMRSLRSARTSPLERLELRAQLTRPRGRGRLARATLVYQQRARRELRLSERPTLRRHLELVREHLGLRLWSDLQQLPRGGPPGAGRPACPSSAPVGYGDAGEVAAPVSYGEPVNFGLADVVRSYVVYGAWFPQAGGCWLAGREARIRLPLERPVTSSLILELSAGAFLAPRRPRQRLEVRVNGRRLAVLQMDGANPELPDVSLLIPGEVVAGCRCLELTLRTPDATSPARLGTGDDEREISVFLHRLVLREPRPLAVGPQVTFGEGSGDQSMLAGGWSYAEPGGRWTTGRRAELLLCVEEACRALHLEFEAIPFVSGPERPLRVTVRINGRDLEVVNYDDDRPRVTQVALPADVLGVAGELRLGWQISDPVSPRALGLSGDARTLGLFVRRLAVLADDAEPAPEPPRPEILSERW